MGIISAIIGWLQYHLGLRTDAASDSGSVHAKIAHIVGTLFPTLQKPRGLHGAPGSFTTALTTYQTALSITGRGRLVYLAAATASNSTGDIQIEIDGTLVALASIGTTSGDLWYPDAQFPFNVLAATFASSGDPHVDMSFKESLVIYIKADMGGGAYVYWQYENE